jgi:LmbE family N-acetylglucosaminyl deacetylase
MIMKWVFLSPHLDDVVFSCGGYIWDLTNAGEDVEIWTLCTADPAPDSLSPFAASLHAEWGLGGDAYRNRRLEDQTACQILNANTSYLNYRDCIYRQSPDGEYFYQTEESIFGGLSDQEVEIIDQLAEELRLMLPEGGNLVAPLGIGNHVDHELARKAANRLRREAFYYADFPYAREEDGREILGFLSSSEDWIGKKIPISDMALKKWIEASQAYISQIPVFWEDTTVLENEIRFFSKLLGGMSLWEIVPED